MISKLFILVICEVQEIKNLHFFFFIIKRRENFFFYIDILNIKTLNLIQASL